MAFFSSLTATGTRVGGQRERQTQAFEAGVAYFPRDYPFTSAYNAYADAREVEEQTRWEKKPPAKRPNFDKLGTRRPWKPDWSVVLGLEIEGGDESVSGEFVTTQRDNPPLSNDGADGKVSPWLLRGPEVTSILANADNLFYPAAGLLAEINRLRSKGPHEPSDVSVGAEQLLKGALVTVMLNLCGRGSPDDLAVIYAINDEEARKWNKMLELRKKPGTEMLDEEDLDEIKVSLKHNVVL
jgi:ribonuclease P/MRP protein subunit POP1